ncbi:MAG TPA: hypothetical protein ENG75_06905 [Nitrospirae bacterium]|nr:hypothetical protein BMS3Bbin08_00464 [bacterium BMS3Bbin08]HDK17654.1 hypothetical protein [Nitrospirota bacterium]
MKKVISVMALVMSLMLFAGEGFSQPPEDRGGPPSEQQMEKIRKRVETLKMWKLTEVLNLDEATASRFFPILNEYDRKRMDIAHKMRKDMKKLRKSVDTAPESELKSIITRLRDNHRRLQKIDDEEMSRLQDILSVRDMGKLIIFKQEFQRNMKKIISDVREKRRGQMRERPMESPAE